MCSTYYNQFTSLSIPFDFKGVHNYLLSGLVQILYLCYLPVMSKMKCTTLLNYVQDVVNSFVKSVNYLHVTTADCLRQINSNTRFVNALKSVIGYAQKINYFPSGTTCIKVNTKCLRNIVLISDLDANKTRS